MTTTDERMLEALKRALKFEDNGVAYYQKAMDESSDTLAIDILKTLRDEEIKHKRRIQKIYDEVSGGKQWVNEDPGAPMPSFVDVFQKLGGKPAKGSTETEHAALKHALDIESNGRTMYEELSSSAPTEVEKSFYERLGLEEFDHLKIIEDSLEYFEDPEGWFSRHEHSGLDGV